MKELDRRQLRETLRASIGDARYFRFIARGKEHRLQWWQERVWDSFVAEHPQFACAPEQLLAIVRWCPLHDGPFQRGMTGLFFDSCVDPGYSSAKPQWFPYADSGRVIDASLPCDGIADGWFCLRCRQAEQHWIIHHGSKQPSST
ncbi:MAG: hypothetical protein ACREP7_04990 [Lysobacter sp.]